MAVIAMKKKMGRPRKVEAPEIDLAKWVFLNPNANGVRVMPEELGIVLGKKRTTDTDASVCRLKIGLTLASKLGISAGDTLCFYSNPEDALLIAAVRRPQGNKVATLDGKTLQVTFSFENRYSFKPARTKIIPYTIHPQGYFLFRIEGSAAITNMVDAEEEVLGE